MANKSPSQPLNEVYVAGGFTIIMKGMILFMSEKTYLLSEEESELIEKYRKEQNEEIKISIDAYDTFIVKRCGEKVNFTERMYTCAGGDKVVSSVMLDKEQAEKIMKFLQNFLS